MQSLFHLMKEGRLLSNMDETANINGNETPAIEKKKKSQLREFIESIVFAVALAAFVIVFIVQGFYIPSGSMRTTLMEGDRILVNKFIYRFTDPIRGDIVVFKYPPDEKRIFIKRIIAVGGETVEIRDAKVYIDGKELAEPYLKVTMEGDFAPVKVPANSFFVMGDNRNESDDSRYWGFVPRKNVVGEAFLIYFPFNRIQLLEDYN